MEPELNNSDMIIINYDDNESYFDESHSDVDMGEVDDVTTKSMSMTNSYSLVFIDYIRNLFILFNKCPEIKMMKYKYILIKSY